MSWGEEASSNIKLKKWLCVWNVKCSSEGAEKCVFNVYVSCCWDVEWVREHRVWDVIRSISKMGEVKKKGSKEKSRVRAGWKKSFFSSTLWNCQKMIRRTKSIVRQVESSSSCTLVLEIVCGMWFWKHKDSLHSINILHSYKQSESSHLSLYSQSQAWNMKI